MSSSGVTWFLIVLGLVGANLPFLNERVFGFIDPGHSQKAFPTRLAEMLVLYGALGLLAHFLEARAGNVASQSWQFFAITGCLFVVSAYPGFVHRYLRRRRDL